MDEGLEGDRLSELEQHDELGVAIESGTTDVPLDTLFDPLAPVSRP